MNFIKPPLSKEEAIRAAATHLLGKATRFLVSLPYGRQSPRPTFDSEAADLPESTMETAEAVRFL